MLTSQMTVAEVPSSRVTYIGKIHKKYTPVAYRAIPVLDCVSCLCTSHRKSQAVILPGTVQPKTGTRQKFRSSQVPGLNIGPY